MNLTKNCKQDRIFANISELIRKQSENLASAKIKKPNIKILGGFLKKQQPHRSQQIDRLSPVLINQVMASAITSNQQQNTDSYEIDEFKLENILFNNKFTKFSTVLPAIQEDYARELSSNHKSQYLGRLSNQSNERFSFNNFSKQQTNGTEATIQNQQNKNPNLQFEFEILQENTMNSVKLFKSNKEKEQQTYKKISLEVIIEANSFEEKKNQLYRILKQHRYDILR